MTNLLLFSLWTRQSCSFLCTGTPHLLLPLSVYRQVQREKGLVGHTSQREQNKGPIPTKQTSQARRTSGGGDFGDRLISLLQEPAPWPYMPDGDIDKAYHCALGIVPMLSKLDNSRRQQAKVDIIHVPSAHQNQQQHMASRQPPNSSLTQSTRTPSTLAPTAFAPPISTSRDFGQFMLMLFSDSFHTPWERERPQGQYRDFL